MSMWSDFKSFAVKGNVVDLAVGFILGGAFGKIVTSLVTDIIMPPIGMLLGGADFSNLFFVLKEGSNPPGPYASVALAKAAGAVTLNIGWMGSTTSVLLLGEAQVPGSLVLSATGNDGAFGDVPIGTTTSRAIVLANPGQIPSGRVTIISDSNRFEVDPGDCNQGDPAGLVDGASCTFNVRFTPDDNLPQAANLTVQSPGAGLAGMQPYADLDRLQASLAKTESIAAV